MYLTFKTTAIYYTNDVVTNEPQISEQFKSFRLL